MATMATLLLAVSTTLEWSSLSSLMALVSSQLILGLDGGSSSLKLNWFQPSIPLPPWGNPDASFFYGCYVIFLWGILRNNGKKYGPLARRVSFAVVRGMEERFMTHLLLDGNVRGVALVVVMVVVAAVCLELVLADVALLMECLLITVCP